MPASSPETTASSEVETLSRRSPSRHLRWLVWGIALGLLLWAFRSVDWRETVAALGLLQPWQIAALVLLNLFAIWVFALRWWFILIGLGENVPYLPLAGYRVAAFGLSYFTPGPQVGGEPLQVLLLERRHGLQREAALASVALEKAIGFMVNFAILAIAVVYLVAVSELDASVGSSGIVLVLFLVAGPTLYLVLLNMNRRPLTWLMSKLPGFKRWRGALEVLRSSEDHAADFCRQKRLHFLAAMFASMLSWLLILAEYGFLAASLGAPLTFEQLILGVVSKRLAYLLLLPSALGAFEAGQVWAWTQMGLNPALGMSTSLVIRLRDMFVGGVGLLWGLRKLRLGRQQPVSNSEI